MTVSIGRKPIKLSSQFGNDVTIQFAKLNDGNYELVVNGEGYVLSEQEIKRMKKYMKCEN